MEGGPSGAPGRFCILLYWLQQCWDWEINRLRCLASPFQCWVTSLAWNQRVMGYYKMDNVVWMRVILNKCFLRLHNMVQVVVDSRTCIRFRLMMMQWTFHCFYTHFITPSCDAGHGHQLSFNRPSIISFWSVPKIHIGQDGGPYPALDELFALLKVSGFKSWSVHDLFVT